MDRRFAVCRRRGGLLWIIAAAACIATQPATALAQPNPDWVRIEGCWSALPLGIALSGEFNRTTDRMATDFMARGSQAVAVRLLERHCDVGIVLHTLGPSAEKDLGGRCQAFRLGCFVVGVAVNAKNPVRTMTAENLGNVFQGKVETWGNVDGAQGLGRIVIYSTDIASTEAHIFKHAVMRGRFAPALERYESRETSHQRPSADGVMGAVIKDVGAIGFFMVGPETVLDDRVRLVRISMEKSDTGVALAAETIANGSYPLADTLTVYLHPNAPQAAGEFVEFATGLEATKIVKQFGLWPEYELEKVRGEQRVADAKAGRGEPVAVCDLAGAGNMLRDASLEFARAKMAVQVKMVRGEAALTPGFSPAGGRGEMRGETLEKLFAGGAELLLADVSLDEAGRGRLSEEGGGKEAVLGRRAVGVVVHPQNRVESLTTDDLRQILSGAIDRWPGDERIALYGLAASSPVMRIVDETLGLAGKRARLTARADSAQVIRTVATQPGALGLIDLTQFPRLETTAKLVAVVAPGAGRASVPTAEQAPDDYPLAQPVYLYQSAKASDAAKGFFTFLAEGGAREAMLANGIVPNSPPAQPGAAVPQADPTAVAVAGHFQDIVLGDFDDDPFGPPDPPTAATDARTDGSAQGATGEPPVQDAKWPVPSPDGGDAPAETANGAAHEATSPATSDAAAHSEATESSPAGSDARLIAYAVPIGLVGFGLLAFAATVGSRRMRRAARHRNEVLARYHK